MSRLGSDVVALAAILGGGAIGGAVSMAALAARQHEPAAVDCVAATAVTTPRIVVESRHSGHAIVVAPRVHVRTTEHCGAGVVVVGETVREDLERAMAELEESRVRLERTYDQQIQLRLSEEMTRLEEELARLGDEAGR